MGFVCTSVNWLWIGTNNWLKIRKGRFLQNTISKNKIFIVIFIARSSGSAHCLSAWWKLLLLGSSMSASPSHPSLIWHDTHRFTHYRRYYRQCCAYPHAWLKPVAVNLSFVFFFALFITHRRYITLLKPRSRRGVRGVDALRILQTGTMDREWCRIYERIAVLERLPTVRQQRPFAPSTEFIVRF